MKKLVEALLVAATLLSVLACVASAQPAADTPAPRVFVWTYEHNKGDGNPGMASNLLAKKGWPGVLKERIKPQLKWLDKLDEPIGILVHLPFGQWTPGMHIDAYDWAVASRCRYLTDDFDVVWKALSKERKCIAYVGNIHGIAHLKDLPGHELSPIIRRNLEAVRCFDRVCIDMGAFAYSHSFRTTDGTLHRSTSEVLTVMQADAIFGKGTTLIEPTPIHHSFCRQLWPRDAVLTEAMYRSRHGYPGERRPTADAEGFGDTDYVKGRIYRLITAGDFGWDAEATMAAGKRVLDDGDVLVLDPYWPMYKKHKARELLPPSP